jgi:hypothetical protein
VDARRGRFGPRFPGSSRLTTPFGAGQESEAGSHDDKRRGSL